MPILKDFVINKLLEYAENYIEDNWDAIVAKGKEYVAQLFAIIRAKINGEELMMGDDEELVSFAAGADEIIANAA